jgi:malate:Na+ symporter
VTDTIVFERAAPPRFWPQGWWRLVDFRIGVVPLAIYVLLAALVTFFIARDGKLSSDLPTMIAVLALGGFGCAEIGKRLPVIRNLGAAAIFATFVPSYLAFAQLLPDGVLKPVAEFTKASNFLYLFIAAVIVGSIFGMDRQVLIKGFIKIFVPLAVGSVVAGTVGTLVGVALGLGAYHTFFYIVILQRRVVQTMGSSAAERGSSRRGPAGEPDKPLAVPDLGC